MSNVTTSFKWPLHPGDLVLAERTCEHTFHIIHRTPSDTEAERLVREAKQEGRDVIVMRYMGMA